MAHVRDTLGEQPAYTRVTKDNHKILLLNRAVPINPMHQRLPKRVRRVSPYGQYIVWSGPRRFSSTEVSQAHGMRHVNTPVPHTAVLQARAKRANTQRVQQANASADIRESVDMSLLLGVLPLNGA